MKKYFEEFNEKHLTGAYSRSTLGQELLSHKIAGAYCALFGIEYSIDTG